MANLIEVTDYILESVQADSELSGFQNIVEFKRIEDKFNISMDQRTINILIDGLLQREEIADVELDFSVDEYGGFDVVLYTDYALNYQAESYENFDN